MRALPPGLYAIADAAWGPPEALGMALLEAGCPVVQLRAKGVEPESLLPLARRLARAAEARGALLIINDSLELAARSGAQGLHLGQDDGPLDAARARLGPQVLLGRSTHDLDQVARALAEGADYLGFGPVFPTRSKAVPEAVTGTAGLATAVRRAGAVPIVAIGGIDGTVLAQVRATGVHGWAVISALLGPAGAGAGPLAAAVASLRGLE